MIRQAARGSAYRTKYKEANKDPDKAASMREELADLLIPQGDRGSKVTIERLPVGVKALGNTWASMKKFDTEGTHIRTKSRVCPHGFDEIPNVHFDPDGIEAPTLAIEHGMFLLQLQLIRNMYCDQVDFKSAFQNTELTNYKIYMKAPKGLNVPSGYRTLQGTKQAAHDFHCHKVDKLLTTYGLCPTP